jgi:hypothetical protein
MIKKPKTYKGIEYVQLSELPEEQQTLFGQTFNRDFIIKIQVNGKIVSDCIQFKDYTLWYEQQFKTISQDSPGPQVESKDAQPKRVIEFELQKV